MSYPTKEQILKAHPKIKKKVIQTLLIWKKDYFKRWKKLPNGIKLIRLEILINELIKTDKSVWPLTIQNGYQYKYDSEKRIIYQDSKRPSIISILHEFAHHIYGKSEAKACKWSIHLFKECFPGTYEKLEWHRHLLVNNSQS